MNPTVAWSLPKGIPHALRVKMLYKRALKNIRSGQNHINWYRYEACLLRARFDQNKNVCDMRQATELLKQGEKELFKYLHRAMIRHPESYLGVAFERVVVPPDWLADYWHPLEKAQYPEYFARRMKRKEEYLINWEEQYMGKKYCRDPPPEDPEPVCDITVEADMECICECECSEEKDK